MPTNKLIAFKLSTATYDDQADYYYNVADQEFWSHKYQMWIPMDKKYFDKQVEKGTYVEIVSVEKVGDMFYVR
jgi:hypothetical protein